jgi:hypothetical protein
VMLETSMTKGCDGVAECKPTITYRFPIMPLGVMRPLTRITPRA